MRILYYSDIHIEFRASQRPAPWSSKYPLDLGPDLAGYVGSTDLVILAGDIGPIRPRRGISAQLYAEQVSGHLGCPVVLVPGNHEYYGGCFIEDRQWFLEQALQNVFILDRGVALFTCEHTTLRILGATLWTDYLLKGNPEQAMRDALAALSDHHIIEMQKGAPFRPEDAQREHMLTRQWLAEKMAEAHDGPTVIVTHHVPHPLANNPRFGIGDRLAPAFASDCSDLITTAAGAGVQAWIYGHNHASQTVDVTGVPLMSAQLGYPREGTGWNGPGLLELDWVSSSAIE